MPLSRYSLFSLLYLDGVYKWNFMLGWKSLLYEITPVYDEMSPTVSMFFHPIMRWSFTPRWIHSCQIDDDESSYGDEKKKKRRVNTSSRMKFWNDHVVFFNFWLRNSNMSSKVNMFEDNESANIMEHKAFQRYFLKAFSLFWLFSL